jgi:AcrR family transcriptional regulator
LINAAATLFSRKGYQHTTLTEVAEEADVHVQTLYRHFKSKDDLAIEAATVALNDCRAFFESAPKNQTTFQIWRAWITRTVSYLSSLGFSDRKKDQLLASSSLMNDKYLVILYSGYEDLLTEFLARDFQLDPKDSRAPRLAACMLWSGNEAAVKRCAGLDGGVDTLTDRDSLLEESLGVIDDTEQLFANYIVPQSTENSATDSS